MTDNLNVIRIAVYPIIFPLVFQGFNETTDASEGYSLLAAGHFLSLPIISECDLIGLNVFLDFNNTGLIPSLAYQFLFFSHNFILHCGKIMHVPKHFVGQLLRVNCCKHDYCE